MGQQEQQQPSKNSFFFSFIFYIHFVSFAYFCEILMEFRPLSRFLTFLRDAFYSAKCQIHWYHMNQRA